MRVDIVVVSIPILNFFMIIYYERDLFKLSNGVVLILVQEEL